VQCLTPTETVSHIQIDIEVDSGVDHPVDGAWLRDHAMLACTHLAQAVTRISVQVVNDATMTELHQRHLGLGSTTDVLTFPASAPGEPIEVDIAVSADEAARQAGLRQHTIERELLLYTLHGLLHCCGYDDHDDAGYRAMHAEEDRILSAIGVGPVFRLDSDGGTDQTDSSTRKAVE
jgi:probable rRNA maturation factor